MPMCPFWCRASRLPWLVAAAWFVIVAEGLAGDRKSGDLDTPEKVFTALQAAVKGQDFEAYKRLQHSENEDFVLWLLDQPNKLHPMLVEQLEEHFLPGKEKVRDDWAAWLATKGRSLETATVEDYYRWRFSLYSRPGAIDGSKVESVRLRGKKGQGAELTLTHGGTCNVSMDGSEWKLDASRIIDLEFLLSTKQQQKRAFEKRDRLRAARARPSPSSPRIPK